MKIVNIDAEKIVLCSIWKDVTFWKIHRWGSNWPRPTASLLGINHNVVFLLGSQFFFSSSLYFSVTFNEEIIGFFCCSGNKGFLTCYFNYGFL